MGAFLSALSQAASDHHPLVLEVPMEGAGVILVFVLGMFFVVLSF